MKTNNIPPLLSSDELCKLRNCLLSTHPSQTPGQTTLSGHHESFHRGHGMDWVDTRAYQPGDDLRHIDWRATARSGKATTKIFQEEQQYRLLLVIDRRQTMAFGTTGALKAAVAARAAAILAFSAIADDKEVWGVVVEDEISVYPAATTDETLLPLLRAIAKPLQPAIPVKQQSSWQQLFTAIEHLGINQRATIFISDFNQLIESSQQRLKHLALQQKTTAISVRDPAEEKLKNIGKIDLICPQTGQQIKIDSSDKTLRQNYAKTMAAINSELINKFTELAIHHYMLSTTDDTFKQLQKWQWIS